MSELQNELSKALQAAKDHAEGKETEGRTTLVNVSLDEFLGVLEHVRADERKRFIDAVNKSGASHFDKRCILDQLEDEAERLAEES